MRRRTAACRNARSATAPGMSRSCVSRCSRSWRTRAKSASRSAGRATMSASSASAALGEPAERRDAERRVASDPMSVSNCAPMRASASCISIADRSPLPSSSMSAVIAASPSLPGGIVGGAAADQQHERHDAAPARGARSRRAGRSASVDFSIAGKRERPRRPGLGQPRSIDGRGRASRHRPPASNPATRQRRAGRAARCSASRGARVADSARPPRCSDAVRHALIAREVAIEVRRDRRGTTL